MAEKVSETDEPVFHEGERAVHRALGIEENLQKLGQRMIRDHMPDQHREFFATLPWVNLGVVDTNGHPWATVRMGQPGFMVSPTEHTLTLKSDPLAGEPDNLDFSAGAKISIVGMELATRRRNRVNATIVDTVKKVLTLKVDQSFGNCPKYIQKREPDLLAQSKPLAESFTESRNLLNDSDIKLINNADTLFIASRFPSLGDDKRAGVDVNHRGGLSGFISVLDDETVEFPDYIGNNFFNTVGNIGLDPRVGLQIFDFKSGSLLNLQGSAEVCHAENETLVPPDTGRRIRIKIGKVIHAVQVFPFGFKIAEYSPFLTKDR